METLIGRHWHHMPEQEVLDFLETRQDNGLDRFEVEHRQEHFGLNRLNVKPSRSALARFLLQFNQPLIYILLSAALITMSLKEWVDAAVILGVVVVNAVIGFFQEAKAVKAIQALSGTMNTLAMVMRSGKRQEVDSTQLVPGDIVYLQSGDKVPADLRLLSLRDLQADESALTGESLPVQKKTGVMAHDTLLADRRNMSYATSLVTYGTAIGAVVATGEKTEVGRISKLISETDALATPLTRKIAYFSHVLLYVILGLAVITFGVGVLRGQPMIDMFMASVALAVGAIPEGLPAAVTITLSIGVSRMAKRRAIIRRLPAVETLGSTTVICSDKTGTLTENQMTVKEILADDTLYTVDGSGYAPEGDIRFQGNPVTMAEHPVLEELLMAGVLCNDSEVVKESGQYRIQGDPTEGALKVSAMKSRMQTNYILRARPRLDTIPFESQHQYMATLHGNTDNDQRVLYVKGSVEAILDRCTYRFAGNSQKTLIDRDAISDRVNQLSERGLRVLAFARKPVDSQTDRIDHPDINDALEFIGLQAMIDPPRKEAVEAVAACRSAGIAVKMITGDHVLTAQEIGRQIGLDHDDVNSAVRTAYTGRELALMTDQEIIDTASHAHIFARVTPEQKLRLVKSLQSLGHVVAMTGDGVNDAPALKQADIGVAMGISGTEVAKEASDMVLTDDNFASIEAAVEEGRGVFDNLNKFIVWTLPTNLGEGLVILAAIVTGVVLPILPLQILWINMITAVLLGLMLSFEPREPGIMLRQPRDPKTPILTNKLIGRIFLVGALMLIGAFGLFNWELNRGMPIEEARTAAVNVFVFIEIVYLFNCRSLTMAVWDIGFFSNPLLFTGVFAMTVLQMMFTYLPFMNTVFQSAPIGWEAWILIMLIAAMASLIVAVEKWITSRF